MQAQDRNLLAAASFIYFTSIIMHYIALDFNRMVFTIAEHPFSSEIDVVDAVAIIMSFFGTRVFNRSKKQFGKLPIAMVTSGMCMIFRMSTFGYLMFWVPIMGLLARIEGYENDKSTSNDATRLEKEEIKSK